MNDQPQSSSAEVLDIEYYTSEAVKNSIYIHPNAASIIADTGRVAMVSHDYDSFSPPNLQATLLFSRVSTFHGRSIEDKTGLVIDSEPIVDEFNDVYTEYSIKGAANDSIFADIYNIEPSGVRVNGLMDASTFERVKTVSQQLRKNGVLTEWPIYFARPKHFPSSTDGKIDLLVLKRKLYDNVIRGNDYYKAFDKTAASMPVGVVGAIGNGLMDMEFGVMYRASLSNARICDIRALDRGELEDRLKDAITSLQLREPDYLMQWDKIKELDPENPEDRQKYLTDILPSLVAENVARFHSSNAYHKYLHDGNVTLAGELVDLDSVMLPDVFEDDLPYIKPASKINEAFEVTHNVAMAIARYLTEIRHLSTEGVVSISSVEMQDYRKSAYSDIVLEMMDAYYAERVLSKDINELEEMLLESVFFDHSLVSDELESLGSPVIINTEDPVLESMIVAEMTNFFKLYSEETEAKHQFMKHFTQNEETNLYKWAQEQVESRLASLNGNMPVSQYLLRQTVNIELVKLMHILKFEVDQR